jgi:hypothetical protein
VNGEKSLLESYSERWEALEVKGLKLKIEFSTLKDNKINSETFFKEYNFEFNNFCQEIITQVKEGTLKKQDIKLSGLSPILEFIAKDLS